LVRKTGVTVEAVTYHGAAGPVEFRRRLVA
jgi:hypothetical protein